MRAVPLALHGGRAPARPSWPVARLLSRLARKGWPPARAPTPAVIAFPVRRGTLEPPGRFTFPRGVHVMSTAAPLKLTPPAQGAKITLRDGKLVVPDNPIIPFIEGDGTGPDIWRASVRVMDAAVAKAYGGKRKIAWMEVLAGP